VYALYPFTVPPEMRKVLKSLGHEADFTYDPPTYTPPATIITDPKIVLSIIRDSTSYTIPSVNVIQQLGTYGNALGGASPGAIKQQKILRQAVLGPKNSTRDFARFMAATTYELVQSGSHKLRDIFEVDIIKHVAILSWTQFAAHLFYIPLKDAQNPKASFDCRELYDNMAHIFRYVYRDDESFNAAVLRKVALQANKRLAQELEDVCEAINSSSFAHLLLHRDRKAGQKEAMPNHGDELLQRLFDGGKTIAEVVSLVVLLAVEIAVAGSFAVSQPNHVISTQYNADLPSSPKYLMSSTPNRTTPRTGQTSITSRTTHHQNHPTPCARTFSKLSASVHLQHLSSAYPIPSQASATGVTHKPSRKATNYFSMSRLHRATQLDFQTRIRSNSIGRLSRTYLSSMVRMDRWSGRLLLLGWWRN